MQTEPTTVHWLLEYLPPADVADILASLSEQDLKAVLAVLNVHNIALMLEEWDAPTSWRILALLPRDKMTAAIRVMPSDDRADLLGSIPEEARESLLNALAADATEVRELLAYAAESSGGIMATELLAVRPEWTSEEALAIVRRDAQEAETAYYVYVTDAQQRLLGVLSLRELVLASPQTKVSTIMRSNPVTVHENDHQEVVADLFRRYHLFALPVVNDQGILKGIVTADDVLDVVDEEATEDMQKMSWMTPSEVPYLGTPVLALAKQRLPWLLILMLSATFTGQILKHFEGLLANLVILTVFIPMLMDTAGNAGSQSSTLIIRGLALGEIDLKDWFQVLSRELLVSLIVGIALATVNFFRILIVEKAPGPIALVVSLALVATVILAKIVGGTLPLVAKALKLDPAIMAGPLITTIVDALALFIYFSLATSLLELTM
ncbi:MAG: magnesium transporter [Firmicutes bacterium]|nr:magnesium transporter [Bacillota bacterium]